MKDKNGMTKHKRERRKKKEKPTPNTPKVYLIFSWILPFCGYAPLVTPVL